MQVKRILQGPRLALKLRVTQLKLTEMHQDVIQPTYIKIKDVYKNICFSGDCPFTRHHLYNSLEVRFF